MALPSRKLRLVAAVTTVALLTALPVRSLASQPGAGDTQDAAAPQDAPASSDTTSQHAGDAEFASLAQDGDVRALVGLQARFTPVGATSSQAAASQQSSIATARQDLLDSLHGTAYTVNHAYESIPFVALTLSQDALGALRAGRKAASIAQDKALPPVLASSTPVVEATESASLGYTGAGRVVAVLDTGVDTAHQFLAGKTISEACYSANADCPGNTTSSTASGSAAPCTYAPSECDHGTHVAGIAVGKAFAGMPAPVFSGVARDAKLVAIQVFSKFTGAVNCGSGPSPCALSYDSDQIAGLQRVLALYNSGGAFAGLSSVNISIGGGLYAANCDTAPGGPAYKTAIDNLRSVGIAVAIAAGNDGSSSQISFPSCISTAISVSATTNADGVPLYTNDNALTELWAPGTGINSSVPNTSCGAPPCFGVKSGTSMATPHVAGAWAVLKQGSPGASVAAVLKALQDTGRPVKDPSNNLVRPRIRVLAALTRLRDTGLVFPYTKSLPRLRLATNGVGLATRAGGPASGNIPLALPSGATIVEAYLIWQTVGGPDTTAVFKGSTLTGLLRGASRDTNWNRNQLGPVRTYLAGIPPASITANGTTVNYPVSGVGGAKPLYDAAVDGQGASLLVVFQLAGTSATVGRVALRIGAATAISTPVTAVVTGLSVPTTPVFTTINIAAGDGQASYADGDLTTKFATSSSTGSPTTLVTNTFGGSDGAMWDDKRFNITGSRFPVNTTSFFVTVNPLGASAPPDSLSWAFIALNYE